MTQSILADLLNIARRVLDEDDLDFNESTAFADIPEWDSLSHVHMVVAMEKKFQVRFDNSELQNVVVVQDLLNIITKRQAAV